jgi:AAA domain
MKEKESILTVLSRLPSVWKMDAKIEWTIEGMLPAGSVTLLSAESCTGKTWVAYGIAGAVAQGKPFMGLSVTKKPVLYIDGENPLGVIKTRLASLAIPETPELSLWGGWVQDPVPGPGDPRMEEFAQETQGLIIWDPLVAFQTGDENSARDTRLFMDHFRKLANLGTTVLVLHHPGKGPTAQNYRGSSDIKAAVDTAYKLTKVRSTGLLEEDAKHDHLDGLKMTNFKSRVAEGKSFSLRFVPGEGFREAAEMAKQEMDENRSTLESILTSEPINGTQFKEKAKAQGISRQAAEQFLKEWPHKKPGTKPHEKVYYRARKEAIM